MSKITKDQLKTCKTIHEGLYRKFVWTSDEDANGVPEFWDRIIPKENGKYYDDCDSFAMEMWYRLKQAGMPQDAMHFSACSVEGKGLDHCTLVLDTESGLYVSECNSSTIVTLKSLPYTDWYIADSFDITKDWKKV
jgi:predicted transglutaminase-like cysteine proteinase